jgi:hypothetical protein
MNTWLHAPLVLLTAALALADEKPASKPNPAGFVLRRGTNLSHWLSQDFGWAPRRRLVTAGSMRERAELHQEHVVRRDARGQALFGCAHVLLLPEVADPVGALQEGEVGPVDAQIQAVVA